MKYELCVSSSSPPDGSFGANRKEREAINSELLADSILEYEYDE